MKFNIKSLINREIIHFVEGSTHISSKYRTIYYKYGNEHFEIVLPDSNLNKVLGKFRLLRRLFRLDKCNVFKVNKDLVIIKRGKVFLYDFEFGSLKLTLKLKNCRNLLHQSICSNSKGYIYFGEYGRNKNRNSVPIYRSTDLGNSWSIIYTFPPNTVKHVHGCYFDKFTDKIWVCTGDFENENFIICSDENFENVNYIGDGSQRFRAVNLIFKEDKVHWLMDSQLEYSYHIEYNRNSQSTKAKYFFKGPIWYIKELESKYYLAATAQEIGVGVLDKKVHLYCSKDLENWFEIAEFEHDGLPKRFFKFGVIGFADGEQFLDDFYMFFEAIRGFDGKIINCSVSYD
jgi:hypothetical protein